MLFLLYVCIYIQCTRLVTEDFLFDQQSLAFPCTRFLIFFVQHGSIVNLDAARPE